MVELSQIQYGVVELNHANLRKLKIEDLVEMLKEPTWEDEVVGLNPDFKLLIKYVLGKRNVYVSD